MNGREISRQTSEKQTNAPTKASRSRTNRLSKLLEDPLPKKQNQFKQQQQQRQREHRLKVLKIQTGKQEFTPIRFAYTVRNISNRVCKTAPKFEKEVIKTGRRIVHVFWNMQNMAISRCCFVTFCRQWQRNEQRIITQAYTAILLADVAVKSLLH